MSKSKRPKSKYPAQQYKTRADIISGLRTVWNEIRVDALKAHAVRSYETEMVSVADDTMTRDEVVDLVGNMALGLLARALDTMTAVELSRLFMEAFPDDCYGL